MKVIWPALGILVQGLIVGWRARTVWAEERTKIKAFVGRVGGRLACFFGFHGDNIIDQDRFTEKCLRCEKRFCNCGWC